MRAMKWCAVAGVLVLSACAGEMRGVVRGTGQPVVFAYEQGMSSDSYSAVVDGESFRGRAVMNDASTSFGTAFTPFGPTNVVSTSTSGSVTAVLLGDRGNSLQCAMRYADSSGLTNVGGVGQCNHSDGRIIDVVW